MNKMKLNKKTKIIISIIIGLLIIVSAYRHWHGKVHEMPGQMATKVTVTTVKKQSIKDQIILVGSVEAKHTVDVSPMSDGMVTKILFKPGQRVKKGDVLVQLDDSAVKGDYQTAQADLKLSKLSLDRAKKLSPSGAISKQDLDKAQADYDDKIGALAVAKANLDYMTLRAPFDGIVGPQVIHVGEYLSKGQVAVSLVDSDNLQITYQVPENDISKLELGQTVTVTSDSYPDQKFAGKVFFIDKKIDPEARTIEVQANVDNTGGELTPGMFVKVKQLLTEVKDAMVIPIESLMPDITGQSVYLVDGDKVRLIPITIGTQNATTVQVTKGLKIGDQVVTTGQQKLRNGSAIAIISEDDK